MAPLGSKQSLTAEKWQETTDRIDDIVPPDELANLIDFTVDDIKTTAKNRRVAYGWSAGKDSIALGYLMRQAGITESLLVVSDLEYPNFTEWVEQHRPDGLTIINTGQNLEWLAEHPHMLFPSSEHASKWFVQVQHKGQRHYFRQQGLHLLALGRRRRDGNYVGQRGENIYTNKQGITRWSPIAHWSHEEIIALLKHAGLALPPVYSGPRGFAVGSGPWPARAGITTERDGWHETYLVDPRAVRQAADHGYVGATRYLEAEHG